jgi:hypothetical protein
LSTYRRIYTIPDIHGRSDLLKKAFVLMAEDGYDKHRDIIVFLGDFIDRGPNSSGVLKLVKKKVDLGQALAVSGNHETFAIHYYTGRGGLEIWMYNGGHNTVGSYPNGSMTKSHIKFIGSLPRKIELQGFFFSHAPVPREVHRREDAGPYTLNELTWTYFGPECEKPGGMMEVHKGPLSESRPGEYLIGVCGHIHRGPNVKEVRIFPKYRMLDCGAGCFPTGRLAIHECVSNRTLYAIPEEGS